MQVLDEVWREDWGRLLGQLMSRFRRADLVEDALAEAFAQAAEQWGRTGPPDNPPAWLREVARRRVLDALRREATPAAKSQLLAAGLAWAAEAATPLPGADVDERLALLFMATHPALAEDVRPALALRFVLGVPTSEIAALFLVPTPTMAARLTRAKARLASAGIPFAVPDLDRWPERVEDVARAIYLAFTSGYAPVGGPEVVRLRVAGEAVRLANLACDLLPGSPVLEALAELAWTGWGRFTMAGAARKAVARTYARLESLTGSPIVRLNRAVAIAEYAGPTAGLALLQEVAEQLPDHHRVALVRAELLRREGDVPGAVSAYRKALELCPDGTERDHIRTRLTELETA